MHAWRSFSEKRAAARADSADQCIFSTSDTTCTAATRSSPRTYRWGWVGLCHQVPAARIASRSVSSATARLIKGPFHEALNLAALYRLPIIFICENNLFAMGTSVKRSTSLKQIVDRAEGYDIPGEIVDGMNFREVQRQRSQRLPIRFGKNRIRRFWKCARIAIVGIRCRIPQVIEPRTNLEKISP